MTGSAIWLICPECNHVWTAVRLPMEAEAALKALTAAFCPACGNDSPKMASAADVSSPAQQENKVSADEDQPYPRITVRDDGPYILHKADPARPRRSHNHYGSAEREARRLAAIHPGAEFIISQEVARVSVETKTGDVEHG